MNSRSYFLLCAILLAFLTLCWGEDSGYKVVIKKNGKVITGKLVSENETTIVLKTGNIDVSFQKTNLDLEKMKSLNQASDEPTQKDKYQELDLYKKEQVQKADQEKRNLTAVAGETKSNAKGKGKTYSESDVTGDDLYSSTTALTREQQDALRQQISAIQSEIRDLESAGTDAARLAALRAELKQKETFLQHAESQKDVEKKDTELNQVLKNIDRLEAELERLIRDGESLEHQNRVRGTISDQRKRLSDLLNMQNK